MNDSKKPVDDRSPFPASPALSWEPPSSTTPETFKTKQEALDFIASQFNLPLSSELMGLPSAAFPKFPTLMELVDSTETPASSKPTGLYEEILQSRPETIYLDALDHGEKYEDGVLDLTRELIAKPRELNVTERALLDRAVISFVETPRPKPPTPPKPKEKSAAMSMEETLNGISFDGPDEEPITATQGDNPGAFWWL